MSDSLGQLATGVAGAAIGYFIPGIGTALGFYLGSLAGSALFPTKLPGVKGPQLSDLSIQTATVGAPIHWCKGTVQTAGNIIFSTDLIPTVHKRKVGGKGQPEQEVQNTTYSVDCAIGICEGEELDEVDGSQIAPAIGGIIRIWADAPCIYDKRPQLEGESDEDFARRLAVTQQTEQKLQIYLGTETQLPDPTIESHKGVGNTLAYRGVAYIVLTDFQLEPYGNRIPNFRFEIYHEADEGTEDCGEYTNGTLYPWNMDALDPRHIAQRYEYQHFGGGGVTANNLQDWADGNHPGLNINLFYGYKIAGDTNPGHPNYPYEGIPSGYEHTRIYPQFTYNPNALPVFETIPWSNIEDIIGVIGDLNVVYWTGHGGPSHMVSGQWIASAEEQHTGFGDFSQFFFAPISGGFFPFSPNPPWEAYRQNTTLDLHRYPAPPPDTADDPFYRPISGAPGYFIHILTGAVVRGETWTRLNTTFKVLRKAASTGGTLDDFEGTVTAYPVGPARPIGHPDYDDQAFWEAAYASAVALNSQYDIGDMRRIPEDWVYGVDYPDTQPFGYVSSCIADTIDSLCVDAADLITQICRRCGLSVEQFDVTDVDSCIRGIKFETQTSGADMLAVIMAYGRINCVDEGTRLKFVTRGAAAVATLEPRDMAAHSAGNEAPTVIETTRILENSLPRLLRLKYIDSRDHEIGEQQSSRNSIKATDEVDISLPVVMDKDEARALVDQMMYDFWNGRNTYQFLLTRKHFFVEPTDNVVVPVNDVFVRMRVTAQTFSLGGILACEAVRDDDGVTAFGAPSGGTNNPGTSPGGGTGGQLICDSTGILLDLPAIRPQDIDAGYYFAVRSLCNNFTCAHLYRSPDGGENYNWVGQQNVESTIGTVLTVDANLSPEGISVELLSGGPLENLTSGQLEDGGNLFAIGRDGRWVIGQFGTATIDTSTIWDLGDIRWGLFGTSQHIPSLVAGDQFVMLTEGEILRIPETPAAIGSEKYFKIVSCGQNLDEAEEFTFTTWGLSYRPSSTCVVLSRSITDPPANPDDGDAYIVPTGATGVWATHVDDIAIWNDQANTWLFSVPSCTVIKILDEDDYVQHGESSGYTSAPWTPAIPPLPEAPADVETLGPYIVIWVPGDSSGDAEGTYYKVLLSEVTTGGGGGTPGDGIDIDSSGIISIADEYKPFGRMSQYIDAAGMLPAAINGCAPLTVIETAAGQPDIRTLNFDPSSTESAQFSWRMPKNWNGGTISFVPTWSHASTATNFGVAWSLSAVAVADDGTILANFGTAQTSVDTGGTTDDKYDGPESAAITIAGTPSSEATVFFNISRVPANGGDTLAIDARLHGITLYYTTTRGNQE